MTSGSISIEQVTPESGRESVVRLLEEYLPEAVTNDRFDWAYIDNPHGVARIWLARSANGDVVGTSAGFPREFRVSGESVTGLVLSDFAIDSRLRSLGPALKLLRATLSSVNDGTFAFALDHPSESMSAVYMRLGGSALGRQIRYVRLLKVSGITGRRLGSGPAATAIGRVGDMALQLADGVRRHGVQYSIGIHTGPFDERFASIGRLLESRGAVCGDRSERYLNWRYRNGIRFENCTVTVRTASELLAYAILQQSADNSAMTIMEFASPDDTTIENALLDATIELSRRCEANLIQASCVEDGKWNRVLKRLGFVARENGPGPVVYASKETRLAELVSSGDQWWLTDGDRDG